MDFSNIIENITSSLKDLGEKIVDFVKDNKLLSMVIGALVLLLLILLLVLGSTSKKKKKEKAQVVELPKVVHTETLIIPNGPEMDNEYNLSRKTEDKWNETDADVWFTVPSDKEINSLSTSNENMIKGIIEAAP